MARGDHIYVDRGCYAHHGVDVGDGTVVERAAAAGPKSDAVIQRISLEEFSGGGTVRLREYGLRFGSDDAVERALSMLGDPGYDLVTNNCEHFATWCVAGEHASSQVEAVASSASLVGVAAIVPSLGVGIIASAGVTGAMSGPNLMSGLAAVGGSAVAGIAILGGASGLIATVTMCLALPDKAMLPEDERQARRAGRYGALAGTALGVIIVLDAVGNLGVPGYSASGLTSGLAALGAVAGGGGMAQGLTAALLIPAVLAAGLGYVLYLLTQWLLPPPPSPAHA